MILKPLIRAYAHSSSDHSKRSQESVNNATEIRSSLEYRAFFVLENIVVGQKKDLEKKNISGILCET